MRSSKVAFTICLSIAYTMPSVSANQNRADPLAGSAPFFDLNDNLASFLPRWM